MNVLLVAPDNGLPGAVNEVRAVSLALHPVVLNGTVTRKDLIDALVGHVWDVLWFATHGDHNGIMLSDGNVPIADLTAIARNAGAYLAVLNSCESRYIGLEMHYELGIDIITTETKVDDLSAYQTGTLLARNLANGLTTQEAYERSKPGQNAVYYLFSAQDSAEKEHVRTVKLLTEGFKRLEQQLQAIVAATNDQALAINMQIDAHDRRLLAVETTANLLQRRGTPPLDRAIIFLITVIMLTMFTVNVYWQFR